MHAQLPGASQNSTAPAFLLRLLMLSLVHTRCMLVTSCQRHPDHCCGKVQSRSTLLRLFAVRHACRAAAYLDLVWIVCSCFLKGIRHEPSSLQCLQSNRTSALPLHSLASPVHCIRYHGHCHQC